MAETNIPVSAIDFKNSPISLQEHFTRVTKGQYINSGYNSIDDSKWLDYIRKSANEGNTAALDYYLQWMMSEASAQSAREYETKQNATRYQTAVADMKKAGLNPYWLESGFSPVSYSGNNNSYSNSNYLSARKSYETERNDLAKNVISSIGSMTSALVLFAAMVLKKK